MPRPGSLLLLAPTRPCGSRVRQHVIKHFHDLAFDPALEGTHQKAESGRQLESVLGHCQGAVDAGSCKTDFVGALALFVSATHAKIVFDLFGPTEGEFSRGRQTQGVMAQDVQISHLTTPMLYKFKSKGTGDLIMLQPNGQRMLEIIGKISAGDSDGAADKGIILPEQMPAALAALASAVAQEAADRKAALAQALERNEDPPRFEAISLRQRALPFMEMLQRCEKAGHAIVWGV